MENSKPKIDDDKLSRYEMDKIDCGTSSEKTFPLRQLHRNYNHEYVTEVITIRKGSFLVPVRDFPIKVMKGDTIWVQQEKLFNQPTLYRR
jgi:hypothetical protein